MQIYFENYSKNTAFSRELSLVSATKLRFMGSYPDALALRSANTTLVYVPMGNIILPAYKNTSLHDLQKIVPLCCTSKKWPCGVLSFFRGNQKRAATDNTIKKINKNSKNAVGVAAYKKHGFAILTKKRSVALHFKKRGREQSSLNGALINGEAASRLMVYSV